MSSKKPDLIVDVVNITHAPPLSIFTFDPNMEAFLQKALLVVPKE